MASRSTEQNRYLKLSTKIKLISADIWFLKSCRKFKVFPNFIKVSTNKSVISDRVCDFAKKKWLELETKYLYSKRSILELEAYGLYKKLTYKLTDVDYENWCEFQRKMFRVIHSKFQKKMSILSKKLKKLKPKTISFEPINIVENISSQTFDKKEIELLNKGLNFALPSGKNLGELIGCIESSIQYLPHDAKGFIREACKSQISRNSLNKNVPVYKKDINIIKGLRQKECFYLKADKGNKVVIMDKKDYFERVDNLIETGPYTKVVRNPLNKMVTTVRETLKNCNNIVAGSLKYKLSVSNPTMSKLYCLPKIHKPGKVMRPIVSAISTPSYNISKWLSKEFETLPIQPAGFLVKNSLEFISKIQDTVIQDGEVLVSFDVSSLFPSVPIPQTLQYLEDLLISNDLDSNVIAEYLRLAKMCMDQNYFQYKNQFYKQHEGTAMGNCLSPFIANLFMSYFEMHVSQEFEYFPRVWYRYVDDIFAVFDTNKAKVDDFVLKLNSKFPSIKFTYELENNEQLPFLDTLVIRNKNRLEFDIFRKDTATCRYIPADSFHCKQHKMASFHFLVHRLIHFPLNNERYESEKNLIRDIAVINGYSKNVVDKLINRHKFKKSLHDTTFFQYQNKDTKFVSVPFNPYYTKGLKNVFNKVGLNLVYKSNNTLKQLLGNPKDKITELEKSGIYEISCKDCGKKYVGQTKRSVNVRYKEHLAHLKYGRTEKSAIAEHAFDQNHTEYNVKLLKNVSNNRLLDAFESIEIFRCKNSLNKDKGLIPYSPLYSLL